MKDTRNKPSNAGIMPSGAEGGGPSGVPNTEQTHLNGCLGQFSRRENITHVASCFFDRAGGNRRNSRWEYAEIGGTICGTESSLFRIFPRISAYFRIFEKNISHGWRRQWLNTGLDAIAEKWSILRNVTKTRYGDLARKFALEIAALSQAMTLRPLNPPVAGPVSTPAGHA
jgi:hypothetical protein